MGNDADLMSSFVVAMQEAIAEGKNFQPSDVTIKLSSGSVKVEATVTPSVANFDAVYADLEVSKTSLAQKASTKATAVPGINEVQTGAISAEVQTLEVATESRKCVQVPRGIQYKLKQSGLVGVKC